MELTKYNPKAENTHAVILSTGTHHNINEFELEKFKIADLQDMVTLENGVLIKVSSVLEILPLSEYYEKYPDKKPEPRFYENGQSYGWSEIKQLTGQGFEKIIKKAPNLGLEAMARGLKKTIAARKAKGLSVDNAEKLLAQMRVRYSVKNSLKQMA